MLLKACDSVTVRSTDELENLVVTRASGRIIRATEIEEKADFTCRNYMGRTASLFYLKSSFSSVFEFEPVDYLRIVFQLERQAGVRIGSSEYQVDPRRAGYILPVGQPATESHPNGYRSLAVRICPKRLQRIACRILGEEIDRPIEFQQPDPLNAAFNDFVRGSAISVAREFNEVEPAFQAAFWDAFEADIPLRLLLHGHHSHTHLFRKRTPQGGRLHRVEDYIREHWNKTLRLEDLAEVAGTSVRTVYNDFVRQYDETPHEFIKRLRLQNARTMLKQRPTPSAMMVALRCGFTSFGHFARAYRIMFGELPSETSKRTRY